MPPLGTKDPFSPGGFILAHMHLKFKLVYWSGGAGEGLIAVPSGFVFGTLGDGEASAHHVELILQA